MYLVIQRTKHIDAKYHFQRQLQSLLRIFRSEGFSGASRVVRFSARTLGLTSRSRVV